MTRQQIMHIWRAVYRATWADYGRVDVKPLPRTEIKFICGTLYRVGEHGENRKVS